MDENTSFCIIFITKGHLDLSDFFCKLVRAINVKVYGNVAAYLRKSAQV